MKSIVLIALMLVSGFAFAADPENALPAEAQRALHSQGQAVLYSLEPMLDPDADLASGPPVMLQRFPVLGQAVLSDAQKQQAVAAFESAIAGWDGLVAACFEPRHALRIQVDGHAYDFLLCYACHQMQVSRDGTIFGGVGVSGSSKALDDLLTSLKLPLSQSLHD